MKSIIALLLVFVTADFQVFSQPDSTKTRLKASANVSLNSNGISSIPSFSLDKPAIVSTIVLGKGRFSYEPVLAYSLDLKPWYIDNWLNYRFIDRKKFAFTVGFNASSFVGKDTTKNDKIIMKAERYFALAFTALFRITTNTSLTAAYWNDNGMDGGVSGHFFSLIGDRSNIPTGGKTFLNASIQVFYIDYDYNNDGLFITPRLSFNIRDFPLSFFAMATQPVTSNIKPYPKFKLNLGLAYLF